MDKEEVREKMSAFVERFGIPQDGCREAAYWFIERPELYREQLNSQPAHFKDTQEDVERFEDEMGDYAITLEELANTSGYTPSEEVDWEVVADYLLALTEG